MFTVFCIAWTVAIIPAVYLLLDKIAFCIAKHNMHKRREV